ncbi:MAG: class I SAM-dependent methyltransferase [Burkholderiales bacterium]|jgi:2-polyprenyl-3-methyl-5-hydroxy-6-metoxy-1,4-benzoquinol methylase/DNA-directed RNA polymerase subunit RPC12/RpoP
MPPNPTINPTAVIAPGVKVPTSGSANPGYACPVCSRATVADPSTLNGYTLSRCMSCGYRFAPTAFDVPVDYREVYTTEEYVESQVDPIGDAKARKAFRDMATYRAFFDRLEVRPGARLLDVGCGVGRFCHAASDAGWNVVGIDVSPEAVSVGRKHARFPLHCGRLEQLPMELAEFDVVTSFEVLEHLADPVALLVQMKGRVRMGGSVFFTVPNWDCPTVRQSSRADWVPPVHLGFHTLESVRSLASAAGFRSFLAGVVETDPFPQRLAPTLGWVRRRLGGVRSEPMGLWVHAVR